MTPVCPDVQPTAVYPISKAAEILGISRRSLLNYTRDSERNGGIGYHFSPMTARKLFTGSDLIAFWKRRMGVKI